MSEEYLSPEALIDAALSRGPDEAVELIINALPAGDLAPDEDSIDAAVARLIGDSSCGDALLERIPLSLLEGLFIRANERVKADRDTHPSAATLLAWDLLDVIGRSAALRRISEDGTVERWSELILELVQGSQFTFGQMLARRCLAYGGRCLFVVPGEKGHRKISWRQALIRVELIARGLIALTEGSSQARLAILSPNRLETALVDLACLSTGIVNVMIPATATEADVIYILNHAEVTHIVVSSSEQLAKVLKVRSEVETLKSIVWIGENLRPKKGVILFESLLENASSIPIGDISTWRNNVKTSDLATIMYTSGTTGTPKGICFSHLNIIFKRFARALALPEIGEEDRFLAYLPLFHTFGRFFELTGSIFWGATYCFAESPSIDSLAREMKQLSPSVFISIPMKWMQFYEMVGKKVDITSASDEEILRSVREITGGNLSWGLSAAGYLDPEIFRFFQRYGIELMSGFGMTEATGGITMTPPGQYREDSLGCALPGIRLALADDGELMIRGPYVMSGYHAVPDGAPSFDENGWFHTGDLMEEEEDGFLRIVDRKKEIYKNVKGQTIAPQKVENLFRDFPSVGRIFLVGDHRPYNTALIYPNREFSEINLEQLSPDELKTHFRSLVVTANSFLAPFESIVDFSVIDRDFDPERGELTPKGTYRRKVIEREFTDVIRQLYLRTTMMIGGTEVIVPNWLFQNLGITTKSLHIEGDELVLNTTGARLLFRSIDTGLVEIGSAIYQHEPRAIDLGSMLSIPKLWLGNDALVGFTDLKLENRHRQLRRPSGITWNKRSKGFVVSETDREAMRALTSKKELGLNDLHLCALMMDSETTEDALLAVRVLEHVLDLDDASIVGPARTVLRRASRATFSEVARRSFEVLAIAENPSLYRRTLGEFLNAQPGLLNLETTAVLTEHNLSPERLDAFIEETDAHCQNAATSERDTDTAEDLIIFLARYGASHPSQFRQLRGFLTKTAMTARYASIRSAAEAARVELQAGFRAWLGMPSMVAVDPETGFEYRWDDVVEFDDDVPAEDRKRLLSAIKTTPLVHEGIFLFSGGATVRLNDILPSGIWTRLLGKDHGKSVYRMAVRSRLRGTFDLAINLNHNLTQEEVDEETGWLVVCSETPGRPHLVEEFGGHWPLHGLWSEEFIPGETLDRALKRLARRPEDEDRFIALWPFAAWAALDAYIDFWDRTGRRLIVTDPVPSNVIVPTHDYHAGARLVSIAARENFESVNSMLYAFRNCFIDAVEALYPRLEGLAGWPIIFSALLEVVGEKEGINLLAETLEEDETSEDYRSAVAEFLDSVACRGFLPRRLFFAGKRTRRWLRLSPEATRRARARTLREMYDTYHLQGLQAAYPEARVRFFRETVFQDAPEQLRQGLDGIIERLRSGEIPPDDLSVAVADLRAQISSGTDEDFFLARLSFPHLRPEDEAQYIATLTAGTHQSEMVVTLTDIDGDTFRIRHALRAKEVGRLHGLFLTAKLQVHFMPEHQFMVAVNDRGRLIGGLFYEINHEEQTAYMDKIVVAENSRRKGIAGALLEELCNRLSTKGIRSLTTGFFRPQFFYKYGFSVERRYSGLVRQLTKESEAGENE